MSAEYEIVITKREKNPAYKQPQGYMTATESEFITHKELITVVSETEFAAIKKACLEIM